MSKSGGEWRRLRNEREEGMWRVREVREGEYERGHMEEARPREKRKEGVRCGGEVRERENIVCEREWRLMEGATRGARGRCAACE